ncbi:hypothetical protein [Kitasatospora purpeofusca]|uniref:hypothetical protein n=1 Tax=Kitasatospora purpeofusca TaxID=67352 RepID=UPI0035DEDF61
MSVAAASAEGSLPVAPAGRLEAVAGSGTPSTLRLGSGMRRRLRTAVHYLLAEPEMQGAGDLDRLLRIIVVAKANSQRMCAASSTAAELGRWAGVGASSIDQALARQRKAGTLVSRQRRGVAGVIGLDVGVPAMIGAKRSGDLRHPLTLQRRELAVFLRLLEVLFAPGWRHADRPDTPGGVLAERRGRGAATDRLALLLLALEARSDGSVRMCGGRIDERRGRSAATLARLLGCTPDGAAKVLGRLQQHGAIELVRRSTRSGLLGRGRILVPAVVGASPLSVVAPHGPTPTERPGSADREIPARQAAKSQARRARTAVGPLIAHQPAAADLHAPHAASAVVPESAEVSGGNSGEAEIGVPAVAGGARARARVPAPRVSAGDERSAGEPLDALRAENCQPSRSSSSTETRRGPGRTVELTSAPVLSVMAEIAPLVDRLDPREHRVAAQAITRVLRVRTAADLGRHLVARLAPMSFDGPRDDRGVIKSPLAWLLSQLPQVTACGNCGRTFHGSPSHFGTCDQCAAGPSAGAVHGICPGCGRRGELFAGGDCAGCEHESAVTAAAELAVQRALRSGATARDATESGASVRRAAAAAAEAAAAAGAHPAFARLAARLAADTHGLPGLPAPRSRMVASASSRTSAHMPVTRS